jgi:hypothetical protein
LKLYFYDFFGTKLTEAKAVELIAKADSKPELFFRAFKNALHIDPL